MSASAWLAAGDDALWRDGGFFATSREPWLVVSHPALVGLAGHFVSISYSASFWDIPLRPVFRFETANGETVDSIAPAPVAGRGIWTGRIPAGTVRTLVSPVNKTGFFSFAICSVKRRHWAALILAHYRDAPRPARSAILTKLLGWGPESESNTRWATSATPLNRYPAWQAARTRPLDLAGIDAPRFDWNEALPVHVFIRAASDSAALKRSIAALEAQIFSRWQLSIFCPEPLGPWNDPRIFQPGTFPGFDGLGPCLVVALAPGDVLLPHALASVATCAYRCPEDAVFYGDEEIDTPEGRRPLFKPGWSPLLQSQHSYLGRAAVLRLPAAGLDLADATAFVDHARLPPSMLDLEIVPLRRVLLRQTSAQPSWPKSAAGIPPAILPAAASPQATITVIIPTRDQPVLLRRALDSLRKFPAELPAKIVIVDNGSIEPATKQLFGELTADPSITILSYPKPFNFSDMCNRAADLAQSDVLVFLNDDTEALVPGWLDRLAGWALMDNIGAAGAKLTYPGGRIQHSGVILGMGGSAGHFGASAAPDAPGWAGQNLFVHETSAVTGACLAVARTKFMRTGGFDAVNLPVELSDIDLCLRLAERGWQTIVDPSIHLMHAESASRGGATFRRLHVYAQQRHYFETRWRAELRDDPFFHPGLSLFSGQEALS